MGTRNKTSDDDYRNEVSQRNYKFLYLTNECIGVKSRFISLLHINRPPPVPCLAAVYIIFKTKF